MQGLVLAGLGYGVLFLLSWFNGTETLERLQERLASQTIVIQQTDFTASPSVDHSQAAEDTSHVETSAHHDAENHDLSKQEEQPSADVVDGQERHHVSEPPIPSNDPLPVAPIDGLFEHTVQGNLPIKRSSDGMTPFAAYAKPYGYQKGIPRISVVVLDYGISEEMSNMVALMPGEVTPILSPYSANADMWMKKARANGHEVWLSLPMETEEFPSIDPGPQAIRSTNLLFSNEQVLNWALSQTSGYSGVAAYHDGRFVEAQLMLEELMREVFDRGLGYAELNANASSLLEDLAEKSEAPYVRGDVLIYAPQSTPQLAQNLALLEARAERFEPSVLVVKPYPHLLRYVQDWAEGLDEKGIALAPLSLATGIEMQPVGDAEDQGLLSADDHASDAHGGHDGHH